MFAEAHSVWPEILAGSNFCNYCVFFQRSAKISSRKLKLPQTFFQHKFSPEQLFSDLINSVLQKRLCLITTSVFLYGIQRDNGLFELNMYFWCTYSIKAKILSMLSTGYFLKIAKN